MYGFSGNFGLKWDFLGEEANAGTSGGNIVSASELVLAFGFFASVQILVKIDQEMQP